MTQIGELFWFSQITWHDITLIHINTLYKYPLVIKRGNEISPAIYEQLSNGQKKEFSVPMLGDGHQSIDNFFGHFFKDSNYGIDDHTPYNPYMYHVLTIAYISLHIHIYIYAQLLGFAQALQRRGFPFPNTCWCNFTKFLWEKQQRY